MTLVSPIAVVVTRQKTFAACHIARESGLADWTVVLEPANVSELLFTQREQVTLLEMLDPESAGHGRGPLSGK